MGLPTEYVTAFSHILSYNLDKMIVPRFLVVKIFESKICSGVVSPHLDPFCDTLSKSFLIDLSSILSKVCLCYTTYVKVFIDHQSVMVFIDRLQILYSSLN